jgi:hypothetical protein
VSQRRQSQLARAKAILLAHRPPETPVVVARNLGRADERVTTVPLAALEADRADMLTLVLVGASATRQVATGGRVWTYTPRGYAGKARVPDARSASPLPDPPPQGGREGAAPPQGGREGAARQQGGREGAAPPQGGSEEARE